MSKHFSLKIDPDRFPWLCSAAAALAFVSTLPGKLFWDSEVLIAQNAYLRDFSYLPKLWTTSVMAGAGVPTNYYRPVATTVLMLGYQLWGPAPFGYHLLNVAVHALNAALVYFVAEHATQDKRAALWTALLFAIHPVQTEQVNYPDHIEGLLAMAFGLGAVLTYLRRGAPGLIAAFYALSLLSKEEGAVFGPILGVLWLREKTKERPTWLCLAPAAAVAGLYVALRLSALNFLDLPIAEFGAQRGANAVLPLRLLGFGRNLLLYARLFVAPFGLHFDRAVHVASWGDWKSWAALAAAAGVFGGLWRISDARGRLGLAWFFTALLPYCGLVPFNSGPAEHYLYIPIVGLLLTVVPLALRVGDLATPRARGAFAVALCAACVYFDAVRNLQWQDPEVIYKTTLERNPESFRAATNLGVERFRAGDTGEARRFFRRALNIKPDYHVALNNLGAVWEAGDDLNHAVAAYSRAIELEPKYLLARKNLAGAYVGLKRYDEALMELQTVLKMNPDYDAAWKLLGYAYFMTGDLVKAQAALRRGLELRSDELTLRRLSAIEDSLAHIELVHRRNSDERAAQKELRPAP